MFTWKNLGYPQTDKHPVVNVSWNDAQAFVRWLSQKERKDYRLPTEAEWEYACRAGTRTRYSFGDNPVELRDYAWYQENTGFLGHPVGSKHPNAFGLWDMHGNVEEWCSDGFQADYYTVGAQIDPRGPAAAGNRVTRGGSWQDGMLRLRSACRGSRAPDSVHYSWGFRVALSLPFR
jgi:formylglycine-generating enzyme required for sulfatase activity